MLKSYVNLKKARFWKYRENPLKIVAFFQFNFYAPAEFEKSTGHMRLKIYTHGQVKGLYKRCAAIFLILPNFEIMTP